MAFSFLKKLFNFLFGSTPDLIPYRKKLLMIKIKLSQYLKAGDFVAMRDTFIRLDTLLFRVCNIFKCGSETVAKQLKSEKAKSLFTRDKIHFMRTFHAIRNKIVHEDYIPTKDDTYYAFKTIDALESILK